MARCAQCGTPADNDERFCSQCGAPLPPSGDVPLPLPVPARPALPPERPRPPQRTLSPWVLAGGFLLLLVIGLGIVLIVNAPPPKPRLPVSQGPRTFAPADTAVYVDFNPRPFASSSSMAWPVALFLDATLDWPTERQALKNTLADVSSSVLPWIGTRCVLAAGFDNKEDWICALGISDLSGARGFVDQKVRGSATFREENHDGVTMFVPSAAGVPAYAVLSDFVVLASDSVALGQALDCWNGRIRNYLAGPQWTALSHDLSPHASATACADAPYVTSALLRATERDKDAAASPLASPAMKTFLAGLTRIGVSADAQNDGSLGMEVVLQGGPGNTSTWWQALRDSPAVNPRTLAGQLPADAVGVVFFTPQLVWNLAAAYTGTGAVLPAPSPSPVPVPSSSASTAAVPTNPELPSEAPTYNPELPSDAPVSVSPTPTPVPVTAAPLALPHAGEVLTTLGPDGVAMLSLNPVPQSQVESQLADCSNNLKQVAAQLELFKADHESYPGALTELLPQYLQKLPVCPAGGKYVYRRHDDGEGYTLLCQGDAHRAAGLPSNRPTFDSVDGLNADRPNLGLLEVFLRNPTVTALSLSDSKRFADLIKTITDEASLSTEQVTDNPLVTEIAGWVDVGVAKDLAWLGVGPSRTAVQVASGGTRPARLLTLDGLRAGPTSLLLYLDPPHLGTAVEQDVTPAVDPQALGAFKSARQIWFSIQPHGETIDLFLDVKK